MGTKGLAVLATIKPIILDFQESQLETGVARRVRIETVRGKSGNALATDTIYHTHRGPMQHAGKKWISRRWLCHRERDLHELVAINAACRLAEVHCRSRGDSDQKGYRDPEKGAHSGRFYNRTVNKPGLLFKTWLMCCVYNQAHHD